MMNVYNLLLSEYNLVYGFEKREARPDWYTHKLDHFPGPPQALCVAVALWQVQIKEALQCLAGT